MENTGTHPKEYKPEYSDVLKHSPFLNVEINKKSNV